MLSIAVTLTLNMLSTTRDQHHHRVRQERPLLRVRVVEPEVDQRRREDRQPVADGGGDGDLADEVEPAGEPAPGGASELRRPVVEAAGGRERRCDLGHRQRDERRHETDEQPAPGDRDRAAVVEGDVVGGETSREDRDDREADREVLEPTHPAKQLLRVAELVEDLLVLRRVVPAAFGRRAHCLPPSSVPRSAIHLRGSAHVKTCQLSAHCRAGRPQPARPNRIARC